MQFIASTEHTHIAYPILPLNAYGKTFQNGFNIGHAACSYININISLWIISPVSSLFELLLPKPSIFGKNDNTILAA
jgi:hypothetical protein